MAAFLLRKMSGQMPVWALKFLGNLWFPYLGSGVKIVSVSSDYRSIRVMLKRKWYNANYVGTQFGGSIYSMTDPFYMLMLLNNLSRDYIVWDKAAHIEFLKPGLTRLWANFQIDENLLQMVIEKTAAGEKYVFDLPVEIQDDSGAVVAKVIKTLYVRKKRKNL